MRRKVLTIAVVAATTACTETYYTVECTPESGASFSLGDDPPITPNTCNPSRLDDGLCDLHRVNLILESADGSMQNGIEVYVPYSTKKVSGQRFELIESCIGRSADCCKNNPDKAFAHFFKYGIADDQPVKLMVSGAVDIHEANWAEPEDGTEGKASFSIAGTIEDGRAAFASGTVHFNYEGHDYVPIGPD